MGGSATFAGRRVAAGHRWLAVGAAVAVLVWAPAVHAGGDGQGERPATAAAAPSDEHQDGPPGDPEPGPPPHANKGGKGKGKGGGGEPPRLEPSDRVPQPTVTGPVEGGIRTGEPYGTTLIPMKDGWIEEEYFFEGTARTVAAMEEGSDEGRPFKSRILVRRPADPAAFNGTVILDWNNVTVPADRDVSWHPMHLTIMERGYVYVAVAAQRLGVEASPLALKQWDPVRYGSLSHPGDDYSFDIFSQAAEAVLSEDPSVLGDLRDTAQRRLALGASQSGGRLRTYINTVQQHAEVFDGFQPQISSPSGVDRQRVPILWVNSGSEAGDTDGTPPDSDLFRLWEIAGTAHTSYGSTAYTNDVIAYSHTNGQTGKDSYDAEDGGAWGYQRSPGECLTGNYSIAGYTWSSALVALDDWVRTGVAPPPMPRLARDADGRVYDEHGNMVGGVRTPTLDVPIATYFGGDVPPGTDPCAHVGGRMALSGYTRIFSAAKLAELYPTADDFVARFEAAIDDALAAGFILPEGAVELRRRAALAVQILDRDDAVATIPGGS